MLETVAAMRSAALAGAEASTWALSDDDVRASLVAVHAAEQLTIAAKLHLIREWDARGAEPSAAGWLREHLRVSATTARRLVALARAVDTRSGVDRAFSAGLLDAEQVSSITATLDEIPADVGPEIVAKAESALIDWAADFAGPSLRTLGTRVLAHVAPEVAEDVDARHLARLEALAHAARSVSLRSVGQGRYRLTGVLDAEAAAVVTAAWDPLSAPHHVPPGAGQTDAGQPDEEPAGPPDDRTPGQRRADALIEVCRLALATGRLPVNGGDRPQVNVTVAYDPLTRRLGAATLDTGDRVSPAQARRLACDAHVVPVVLGGAGQVLDLGRSRRLITGALRRALMLRDRGCAFPGCDRPPRWCDGHHIRSWLDGGPTSLDNAVLLCGHHHRTVHQGGWAVRLTHDRLPEFIPPTHIDPERRPRRNIYHDRR